MDLVALARQMQRRGMADTGRGAGDQADFQAL